MIKRIVYAAVASLAMTSFAHAEYPTRPIRLVIASAPGSGGDALGRLLAQHMASFLKGSIVVENKPGAGGAVAMEALASSTPDGYTIGLGSNSSHILIPIINKSISYDPIKDFTPIGALGTAQTLLIAAPDFPANSLQELLDLANASKNPIQYASWGNGSSGHFCGALLSHGAKVTLEHIPYKSVAQIQTDLLGGHVQLGFVDMGSGITMVKDGRTKPIASCTERTGNLPEVSGYNDAEINISGKAIPSPRWALYVPVGTPGEAAGRLSQALETTLKNIELRSWMESQGISPVFIEGEKLVGMNQKDIEFWTEIAKAADITVQ